MTAHGPSRGAHRPLIGLFVGLGVLALVAVPVAWCAFYAYVAGVTGWNSDPEPAVGLLWGGAALALLALPVLASLLTARASLPRARRQDGGGGRDRRRGPGRRGRGPLAGVGDLMVRSSRQRNAARAAGGAGEVPAGDVAAPADLPPAPLVLEGLTKRFGDLTAVDAVTLAVPAGSFYGLVGPNGAGKTTLLSMAVGALRPDAGTSAVQGHDIWADPVGAKAALGVLPEADQLPRRLTAAELLTSIGLLRGMPEATVAARTAELIGVLGLGSAGQTLIADCSTGMRKKIALAVALLHGPSVLVLDEPLESVDPVSASTVRAILQSFTAAGGTVVFSSHVMPLVELLCDHVAVLAAGRVVAAGALDDVRGSQSLDQAFASLVGSGPATGALSWFAS